MRWSSPVRFARASKDQDRGSDRTDVRTTGMRIGSDEGLSAGAWSLALGLLYRATHPEVR